MALKYFIIYLLFIKYINIAFS